MATTTLTPSPQEQQTSLLEKIVHWLFFGVIFTLAPFLALSIDDVDRGITPSIATLFGRGELLIVAAIIAAGGIGDLFNAEVPAERKVPRLIVLILCLVALVVTCFWFADVSSLAISKHPPNPRTVAEASLAIFVFATIAGLSALVLSET